MSIKNINIQIAMKINSTRSLLQNCPSLDLGAIDGLLTLYADTDALFVNTDAFMVVNDLSTKCNSIYRLSQSILFASMYSDDVFFFLFSGGDIIPSSSLESSGILLSSN